MFVLYHRDLDGICSAAIVNRFEKEKNIQFQDINYNEEIPFKKIKQKEKIYIVDFSLTEHQWEVLFSITKNIIWIDHHKTIFEGYNPSHLTGTRVSGKAASQLTWEYFTNKKPTLAVKLIADYDVWKFEFGDKTKYFNYGIQAEDYTDPSSKFWTNLLTKGAPSTSMINKIIKNGQPIINYDLNTKRSFITNNHKYITFNGLRFIVANITTGSITFENIDPDSYEGIFMFHFNGKNWNVSMRTNNERAKADVSVIARKFGGGGHAGAAGFETDFETIQKILNNKL